MHLHLVSNATGDGTLMAFGASFSVEERTQTVLRGKDALKNAFTGLEAFQVFRGKAGKWISDLGSGGRAGQDLRAAGQKARADAPNR